MSSPKLLAGKSAAITGAATGIGRAITLEYLRQGAKVAINYYPDPKSRAAFQSLLSEASSDPNIITSPDQSITNLLTGIEGDINDPLTAQTLITTATSLTGRLDIFISNAGICTFSDFLSLSPDLLRATITTNLTSAWLATQTAAKQMAHHQSPPGGSIIGVSSISALVGGAGQTHYTPTKAGILSLMQSCACALGRYGIRCNALLPGTIRTGLNEEDLKDEGKRAYMEGRIPLGRLGAPGDLGGPAVFLGSDMSTYVTGAQLLVDGGLFVNLQ